MVFEGSDTPPTGRRGIAIADILLLGPGGESFGTGGRAECNNVEIEVNVGDLSLLIGAGADPGGRGSAFENLDRPLGGAFGNVESIPSRPAIGLDQIAVCKVSWSTNNC